MFLVPSSMAPLWTRPACSGSLCAASTVPARSTMRTPLGTTFWVSTAQTSLCQLFILPSLPPFCRHYGWHYVSGVPHGSGRLAQGASHRYCARSAGCWHSWCRWWIGRCHHTARCFRVEATYSCAATGYDGLTMAEDDPTPNTPCKISNKCLP